MRRPAHTRERKPTTQTAESFLAICDHCHRTQLFHGQTHVDIYHAVIREQWRPACGMAPVVEAHQIDALLHAGNDWLCPQHAVLADEARARQMREW